VGRALAALRDEGVLILGSGLSFHNMHSLLGGGPPDSAARSRRFDSFVQQAAAAPTQADRAALLGSWASAPEARFCHPREEHLLPLMVVAGAGGDDPGSVPYSGMLLGAAVSSIQYG
jgi:aromatic ring-opening dioxygenase catalytic subunit (LigB family)